MRYTKNLHLAKPSPDDFYDIAEFGNNMDILDEFYGTTFQESNRNLLDNAWFTLNSRGQNSYGNNTNSEMSVDRWRCDTFVKASYSNGKWTIRNDDSTNVRGFSQTTVLDLLGKTVTYSVLVDGKITSVTFEVPMTKPTENTLLANEPITGYDCQLVCWHYPNGQLVFHINLSPSASIIPEAVKLELGEVSTLDKDNPPDDRLEYIKCITSKADPTDTYANKPINFASNPNLLDNPWFTVNQGGQTEYGKDTTFQYSVDRWICDIYVKASYLNGKWTIRNDDTTTTRGFIQKSELNLKGKTVTYSILADGKITSVTFEVPTATPTSSIAICYKPITDNEDCFLVCWFHPDDSLAFHLNLNAGASITLEALKLEVGFVSTLANDVPPNYAEELLKCQWYYETGQLTWTGNSTYAKNANFPLKTKKRVKPTVIVKDIDGNPGKCSFWDGSKYISVDARVLTDWVTQENIGLHFQGIDSWTEAIVKFKYEASAEL